MKIAAWRKPAAGILAAAMVFGSAGCGGGESGVKREEVTQTRTVQLFGPNTRARWRI